MFLDVGIGILVSIFISFMFDVDFTSWLVVFSILFALLPDFDFLYFYPKKEDTKYDHKHRDYIHYPLIYLPVGTFLIWLLFGAGWGLVFFLSSFLHFVHDSIGIGWGVKWLFPFSKNNYAFFYLYSKKIKKGLRKTVFIFTPQELSSVVREHGDADWVKNIYFKWHPIAIFEFSFFVLSLFILFFYAN